MSEALVGMIMGSDSDWPVMQKGARALAEFGIGCEVVVTSAHRHPEKTISFAKSAAQRGLKVIIAGAGGAAHLPGVVAALTVLPVIGVPVAIKPLEGIDSLLSIVQMPPGIPVATVTIDGAYNAGLLAVEILALSDTDLKNKLEFFRQKQAAAVEEKDCRLQELLAQESLSQGEKN